MKRFRSSKGFSTIELLAVVGIVVLLAGILFGVSSASRAAANRADEAGRLRQIFVAIALYEEDNDRQSPISLVDLVPRHLPTSVLRNPSDARNSLKLTDWPANPWVDSWIVDPPAVSHRRTPHMNSYAYLKPFSARFPAGRTWEEFRQNPRVGIVAGLGLFQCASEPTVPGCGYGKDRPEIFLGQPAFNLAGTILTVRMDGSIHTRTRKAPARGNLGFEQLFFDMMGRDVEVSVNPN